MTCAELTKIVRCVRTQHLFELFHGTWLVSCARERVPDSPFAKLDDLAVRVDEVLTRVAALMIAHPEGEQDLLADGATPSHRRESRTSSGCGVR